jgi:hypothetical protein
MADDEDRHGIGGNSPPLEEVLADTNKALIEEIGPIALRANTLAAEVKNGIKTEEQLGKVGELVTDAKALARRIEGRRVEEKKPHLEAGRTVDSFFATYTDRLDRIETAFTSAASAYQRDKVAKQRREAEEAARKLRDEEERKRQEAEKAKRPETVERKLDEADELAAQADAAEARAASSDHELAKVKTETGVTAGASKGYTFKITDYEAIPLDKLRPYIKREEIEKALRSFAKIHKAAASLPGVHFEEEIKASFRR